VTNAPNAVSLAISPNPAVTSVSPAGGQVTLTGVGFEHVLGVSFGGASATSYTVTSPTTITATVPPGNPGPVYAFVTTIRGSSEATSGAQYTYQSVPTVTGVSPAYGVVGGGGVSTITGTGLSGPATVMYGTKPGKILSQSPTEIRASAPSGTAGSTVNITVTNTVGTSAISSADEYRYFELVHIPTPPIRYPTLRAEFCDPTTHGPAAPRERSGGVDVRGAKAPTAGRGLFLPRVIEAAEAAGAAFTPSVRRCSLCATY
jgi:hypothetical protein